GRRFSEVAPAFARLIDLPLTGLDAADLAASCDLVVTALPHGVSSAVVPDLLERGLKVLDHSGDFRYRDAAVYEKAYKLVHPRPDLLAEAVYGLPELYRAAIAKARLVANPGCYPTCSALGLAPLFANHLVAGGVMIDAKSGTSGAGVEPTRSTHHPNCGASVNPYNVGTHRHTPEIIQTLTRLQGGLAEVVFTPHLIPVVRGMLCTMYLKLNDDLTKQELLGMYTEFFRRKRFVRMTEVPWMQAVIGSNHCEVGLEVVGDRNVVVMSAIDNLVKGGAGQAVQNCNAMFGWPEETGLDFPGLGV
ncbi:MAG TPA: N-acetyl-gamma-glutamyl-phosphate reductase, partial [Methanomassiliicoccales archaeon]|nr:N-acetyl-gamma-glutamyl-phosphate reductase [Methanomassiliicoccales archaeon]